MRRPHVGTPVPLAAKEAQEKAMSPVKVSYDLNTFIPFIEPPKKKLNSLIPIISVNNSGRILLNRPIKEKTGEIKFCEFYLSRNGSVLIAKPSTEKGLPVRNLKRGLQVQVKALKDKLIELNIEIPVQYTAEWNEEMQAWIGRRR